MDDDIIRIRVSSDNHLGFCESDSIRCDDSFASFEEVLVKAKLDKCDLVILGGDLFHDQKPSRRTLHSTIQILRKYSYGDDPIYIDVLNSESDEGLLQTPTGLPNFLDPYQAISLPIFAIHGNHDEPSHDRGAESLSALDILSSSNLINYFGKSDNVDDINIKPICIKKKSTYIALYPLGAINDERLNRMFEQKKVFFHRPEDPRYFHILIVHQNADKGRGRKNCLHSSSIPKWIDLVIWGNEHECINEFIEIHTDHTKVYQPGSSIVTSFHETESIEHPKYMGHLEVKCHGKLTKPQYRLVNKEKYRYTQFRPFFMKDISLSEINNNNNDFNLNPLDPDIENKLNNYLKNQVSDIIKLAQEKSKELYNQTPNNMMFRIKEPSKVLIR